ncbi:MAG: DnaJ domain-containing protein [Paludibacteraceae bacterium]|nr:DnaJ domain-containing protein [Paludibacteraceae bacterium]
MTKDQIESYVSRRAKLGKSLIHYFPFIREVCKLNEDERDEQVRFLSDWFSEDELETHVFQKTESDSKLKEAIETMRRSDITERKQLVEMLFKLSVVEDGIHNDEWKLLMDIMTQLKFNKNYFEYFKNRYSSLRTEFEEYEYKNELSSTYHGDLKPYYELLGLEENCSIEEMRRAYHSLAMQHHPDLPKNAGRIEECEAMMTKINEAYEMLRG